MPLTTPSLAAVWILLAAALDWGIGDPLGWPHPVVVMGWWIGRLRRTAERVAGNSPPLLRCAGLVITLLMVVSSGLAGWGLEQLALGRWTWMPSGLQGLGQILVVVGLGSALAGRSLQQAVLRVTRALRTGPLGTARDQLQWIVGRDTKELDAEEVLRAAAETAAENAVDGLFAPLFWMIAGLVAMQLTGDGPGPLALAWSFKATSTLDSMLGYRNGSLRWLGTAGARFDDLLVWIPCRFVMVTLPLVTQPCWRWWSTWIAAERDGRFDPSPNAGRAEAIYAHCIGVRLGGLNRYGDRWIEKPTLAAAEPPPDERAIRCILAANRRLELLWLLAPLVLLVAELSGVVQ